MDHTDKLETLSLLNNFGAVTSQSFYIPTPSYCANAVKHPSEELQSILTLKGIDNNRCVHAFGFSEQHVEINKKVPNLFFYDLDNTEEHNNNSVLNNFSYYDLAEASLAPVRNTEASIIVVNTLLERIPDPLPFLSSLRSLLFEGHICLLIIDEYPVNKDNCQPLYGYVRQWTANGSMLFLEAAGFKVSCIGRSTHLQERVYFEVSADALDYQALLSTLALPPPTIEYLVVSQEHSAAALTGGIGTYVGELEMVIGPDQLGIFLIGTGELLPPVDECHSRHYIHLESLGLKSIANLPLEAAVAAVLDVLIYIYPSLKVIEIQDVNGKMFQFLQTKLSGKYPSSLMSQVVCHASRISLEKLYAVWLDPAEKEIAEEKFVIENADVLKFPTRYLHDFYQQVGYAFTDSSIRIERLPFCYTSNSSCYQFKEADTLIFFGKRSHYKGYDIFADTVRELIAQHVPIARILLIGPRFEEMVECNLFFDSLGETGIVVEEYSLQRERAIALIRENANRAICVISYVADNHPYSLLEVIDTGCMFVATNTGGIPELIPASYKDDVLCSSDPKDLARLLMRWIDEESDVRQHFVESMRDAASSEQEVINQLIYPELMKTYDQWNASRLTTKVSDPSITCVIIVERCTEGLYNLLCSIHHQIQPPARVLIVVPKSSHGLINHVTLEMHRPEGLDVSVLSVKDAEDGAMLNEALTHISSEFLVVLHPGVILNRSCFSSYVTFIQNNPWCTCVSSFLGLYDVSSLPIIVTKRIEKYLGDGVLTSQIHNALGHPFGMYRTEHLKKFSGFVPKMGLSRNGWSMQLKLASSGCKLGVVPSVEVYFPHIDARYGENYDEQYSLAMATSSINRFESFRLQSHARHLKKVESHDEDLVCYIRSLEAQLETKEVQYRSIPYLVNRLARESLKRCMHLICGSAPYKDYSQLKQQTELTSNLL